MPLYEFQCQKCKTKSSKLVRRISEPLTVKCPSCGSDDLVRVISKFAYHKSMSTIWEESGDVSKPGSSYYQDPRNLGRWAESKFKQIGMEVPPDVKETIQAAREGTIPDPLKE
jgi:putative FmdB family regulatory protein